MTVVKWEGIPEKYWPDTEKPWRVTWGIGVFQDFATEEEAKEFQVKLLAEWGDDICAPGEPFNAIERDAA